MQTEKQGYISTAGDPWNTIQGTSFEEMLTSMGQSMGVSPRQALENVAVMLCVDILAQDISKAGVYLRKRTPRGSSIIITGNAHPVAKFLALDPNARHTWKELWEMSVAWLALMSNSYIYAPLNRRGEPRFFIPLQPGQVQEQINDKSRETFYDISASNRHERALLGFTRKRVPERDIIHFRSRMMDGFYGLPTIQIGASTLKMTDALEDFRKELVEEAGQMRGVFFKDAPGALDPQAFERLKTQMRDLMRRYRTRQEPVVLEDELKFKETSSNPADMELVKQLDIQVVQNCRLFRIPPHKAMHLINVKYENMEVLEKAYVGDTLDPILKGLEQRLTRSLLSEDDRLEGYFIEFDRSELTLRDPKVMMEQTERFFKAGLISRGEGRIEHGWQEDEKRDDVFTIPTSVTLVGPDNKPILEPPKPEPAPAQQPSEPKKGLRVVGGDNA